MLFLGIFYTMLVDMENFYAENGSTEATIYIFIFSNWTEGLDDSVTTTYTALEDSMLAFYTSAYTLFFTYLNPIVWVNWVVTKINEFYDYIASTF
jgi:hypothetical protein